MILQECVVIKVITNRYNFGVLGHYHHRHQAVLVASRVKYCNTKSIIGNVTINYFTRSSFVIYAL